MGLFLSVVIFAICLLIAFLISKNTKTKNKEINRTSEPVTDKRKEYMKKYNLYKREAYLIEVLDFDNYTELNKRQNSLWMFKENNDICFVSKDYNNDIGKIVINVKNIKSFSRLGDIDSYTEISGGNGGGSSIGKAIVGGVVAGGVGAVVASRNKVNEIKTRRIINDDRITILELNKDNREYYLRLTSKSYNGLIKLMPEKEISFIRKEQVI